MDDYVVLSSESDVETQPTPPWSTSSVSEREFYLEQFPALSGESDVETQLTQPLSTSSVSEREFDLEQFPILSGESDVEAQLTQSLSTSSVSEREFHESTVVESRPLLGDFVITLRHRRRDYWECNRCSSVTDLETEQLKCPACDYSDVVVEYFTEHLRVRI